MTQPSIGTPDAFAAHLINLRETRLFRDYLEIREWILRLKALATPTGVPSAYWREELAGFEYMLDASPLVLEKLRHHSFHLTGLKVYDYRTGKEDRIPKFRAKMAMLESAEGARNLLVPEAPDLGGFGFEIDGALVNIDTLKFWEVMIALDKAAVLGGFRDASPGNNDAGQRRVVWEIGAGWGGFARSFKVLFPRVSYVIVDLPETMLFSALYLKHMFPEARFYLHETGDTEPDWSADFLLFAHTDLEIVRPPRLDLVLNMVSFQEMTSEQVSGYVEAAWERGAQCLYSLNRERSFYNTELESVSQILSRRFWPHEVPVLDLPYTRLPEPATELRTLKVESKGTKKQKKKKAGKERDIVPKRFNNYRHIVGWRKTES